MNAEDKNPEYMFEDEARQYLRVSRRMLPLWRRLGILKPVKFGKAYVYRREWLDSFADSWQGYDIGTEAEILASIALKEWKRKHE